MSGFDLSLYLVLDPDLCRDRSMAETARQAVLGGATMVQLRDKDADVAGRVATGRALKAALAGTGVPLIVNDDVDAALAIGADGLHIGQDDMPAREARARLGAGFLIGLSVEDDRAMAAVDVATVDYVGLGPVFATATKPDHKRPIGLDGLARLARASPVPAVAIGGIKACHVAHTLAAGADGVAVVSAICANPDPEGATREIRREIRRWRDAERAV